MSREYDSMRAFRNWILSMVGIAVLAAGLGIWQTWCPAGRRCMDLGGHYYAWDDTCTIDASLVIKEFSENVGR